MKDRTGREIMTGDVVRISGAYFKKDNGLYVVEHSPGDASWCGSDHCLHKISKTGHLSTAKYSTAFWPLIACCSDRLKNAVAWEWNHDNATIEVVDTVDRTEIRAHFEEEVDKAVAWLDRKKWDLGKHSRMYITQDQIRRHYLRVLDRIS